MENIGNELQKYIDIDYYYFIENIVDEYVALFDEKTLSTQSMRKKETVDEYRYMPDPDIVDLIIDQDFIDNVIKKYDTEYLKKKEALITLFKENCKGKKRGDCIW